MSKKVFIISLITILLVAVIGYTTYFIMQILLMSLLV